ncbi:4-hydroxythreonine-4-phosphate dehydrogenase [Frankliniella fusca]|uniref:4-hydroxythreonine-4-phosphate dehydrogenase n=1 Tax=Frankliniella fusca TaxID=407009 RepID=A0AAE1GX40_9NEOP|nr:4-hydroxythreonine-4-phosphate dehydrogenase [Frankliniella fusca]
MVTNKIDSNEDQYDRSDVSGNDDNVTRDIATDKTEDVSGKKCDTENKEIFKIDDWGSLFNDDLDKSLMAVEAEDVGSCISQVFTPLTVERQANESLDEAEENVALLCKVITENTEEEVGSNRVDGGQNEIVSSESFSADETEMGPNCFCKIPAVRRTSKKSGRPFWGCTNYFATGEGSKKCHFHRFAKSNKTKTSGCDSQMTKPGAFMTPFQVASQGRQERGEKISDQDVLDNEDGTYIDSSQTSKGTTYLVTADSCTCPDRILVCKHIVKIRQIMKKALLKSLRWLLACKVVATQVQSAEVLFKFYSIQSKVSYQVTKACCVCNEGEPLHSCSTCKRPVHAIPPCSNPGPEEGYGKDCICQKCGNAKPRNAEESSKKRKLSESEEANEDSSQADVCTQSRFGRKIKKKIAFTPTKNT